MNRQYSQILMAIATLLVCFPGQGFYSFMDTGELLNKGYRRVQAETQIILDKPADGLNFNGRFSTGLNDDSDIQAELGVGSIDFYVAGFWKWVPFPDTRNQPAVGGRFGLTYAKVGDISTYGIQSTPFISKRWNISPTIGVLTPFFAIPIGLQQNTEDTVLSVQGTLGTQYIHPKWRHTFFLLEFGFDIDDAFDHVSLAVAFDI